MSILETNRAVYMKIENPPKDPVVMLLGIYPKDAQLYNKDSCSTIFIIVLFLNIQNLETTQLPLAIRMH